MTGAEPIVSAAAGPTALDWVRAAGPLVGALGGASGGPSRADSGINSQFEFGNGWTVDFGEGDANGQARALSIWWVVPAGIAALALIVWARKQSR